MGTDQRDRRAAQCGAGAGRDGAHDGRRLILKGVVPVRGCGRRRTGRRGNAERHDSRWAGWRHAPHARARNPRGRRRSRAAEVARHPGLAGHVRAVHRQHRAAKLGAERGVDAEDGWRAVREADVLLREVEPVHRQLHLHLRGRVRRRHALGHVPRDEPRGAERAAEPAEHAPERAGPRGERPAAQRHERAAAHGAVARREREHRRRGHELEARRALAVVLTVARHPNGREAGRVRPRHARHVGGREPPRRDRGAGADPAQQLRPWWEGPAGDPDHRASAHWARVRLNLPDLPLRHHAERHRLLRGLLHVDRHADSVLPSCFGKGELAQQLARRDPHMVSRRPLMPFQQARAAWKQVLPRDADYGVATAGDQRRLQRAQLHNIMVIEGGGAAGHAQPIAAHLHSDQPWRMGWSGAIE